MLYILIKYRLPIYSITNQVTMDWVINSTLLGIAYKRKYLHTLISFFHYKVPQVSSFTTEINVFVIF